MLFLVATVEVPEPHGEPGGFVGVDLGIVNIATTSDGHPPPDTASTATEAATRTAGSLQTKKDQLGRADPADEAPEEGSAARND